MKEKELRIALVCYGGVSLAVYMHGVTKEILKLVRASRVYHHDLGRSHKANARYSDIEHAERETDTEELYFELIRAIGQSVELRVFVDTVCCLRARWRMIFPSMRIARCGLSRPISSR